MATTRELITGQLTQLLERTEAASFDKVLAHFPEETLEAVLERVRTGSKLEVSLYTDVFNVNQFKYGLSKFHEDAPRVPLTDSLRVLNSISLTSHLVDDIDACGWHGWDAVTYTLRDALHAIPREAVRIGEMDAHRLRSAVLVNIVVDRSFHRPHYQEAVDFFEIHYDAIRACLPALAKRHADLNEVDLGIVAEFVNGIPVAMAEGVL
jgi:hypothetical protein